MNFKEDVLVFSEELRDAIQKNKPIVALESTIISHGMPYPQNVETALDVEELIRDNGAVPATIAIINGEIKIGLTEDEIEFLGQSNKVEKVSRRDLPYVISAKKHGATTVAGTMICASMADIKVFATGGIGGVHRGAQKTMDISADLEELAKTNVAVVCAGVKSILDLGLTLEYLETNGVPVIGHNTDILPAFYTRTSPFKVDYRLDSPEEIANFIDTKQKIGLSGGVVVANPIPEKDAMDETYISSIIDNAVKEAEENNILGKEATPFILDKIKTLTEGKSLKANIGLVKHNAVIGAKIAANCKHGYKN